MEAAEIVNDSTMVSHQSESIGSSAVYLRGGDDDFSIHELLIELAVLAFFVGGCDQRVALVFEPFADAQLVFCRS